jgi:hypothetical protein
VRDLAVGHGGEVAEVLEAVDAGLITASRQAPPT